MTMLRSLVAGAVGAACACASAALPEPVAIGLGRIISVGPHRLVRTVAEAARVARDGDTVEIDAGEYRDDVATWRQNDLTVRGVGGRARMVSPHASAEGKAIWVVKGDRVTIEHVEFEGARVPDRNGAGLRHEGGKLAVRDCLFAGNEMGLLTSNDERAELSVEASEFRDNAVIGEDAQDNPGHQIYVGTIGRFELRDSWVHRGAVGHLVKSRARVSWIVNNRITDEADGHSSYEIEFANGGIAHVIGNLIEQSARSENEVIVSFGAERYRWPTNELYVVNNTVVDDMPRGGRVLALRAGFDRVRVADNLVVGAAAIGVPERGESMRNVRAQARDFASPSSYDYRLDAASPLVGTAVDPGDDRGVPLRPTREYVQPLASRPVPASPYSPGAMQSVAR